MKTGKSERRNCFIFLTAFVCLWAGVLTPSSFAGPYSEIGPEHAPTISLSEANAEGGGGGGGAGSLQPNQPNDTMTHFNNGPLSEKNDIQAEEDVVITLRDKKGKVVGSYKVPATEISTYTDYLSDIRGESTKLTRKDKVRIVNVLFRTEINVKGGLGTASATLESKKLGDERRELLDALNQNPDLVTIGTGPGIRPYPLGRPDDFDDRDRSFRRMPNSLDDWEDMFKNRMVTPESLNDLQGDRNLIEANELLDQYFKKLIEGSNLVDLEELRLTILADLLDMDREDLIQTGDIDLLNQLFFQELTTLELDQTLLDQYRVIDSILLGQEFIMAYIILHPPNNLHPFLKLVLQWRYANSDIAAYYEETRAKVREIYERAKAGEGKIRYQGRLYEAYLPLSNEMSGNYELVAPIESPGNMG